MNVLLVNVDEELINALKINHDCEYYEDYKQDCYILDYRKIRQLDAAWLFQTNGFRLVRKKSGSENLFRQEHRCGVQIDSKGTINLMCGHFQDEKSRETCQIIEFSRPCNTKKNRTVKSSD